MNMYHGRDVIDMADTLGQVWNHVLNCVFQWGMLRGISVEAERQKKENTGVRMEDIDGGKGLSYGYRRSHGVVDLWVGHHHEYQWNLGWGDLRLLSRGEVFNPYSFAPIDSLILRMLPSITTGISVRPCENQFCAQKISVAPEQYEFESIYDERKDATYSGGRWLCNQCLSSYSLSATNWIPTFKEEDPRAKERAKMTAKLRFEVLERDGFRCRACGRSPHEHIGVVLHVDHIFPVAMGGKTTTENLQTLCADCNIAKSDKVVDQMELWNNR